MKDFGYFVVQNDPIRHNNRNDILDFKVLKHFASDCKQVFSTDRWAITGVAGVFTDPLYSPGSELISVSNMIIADLILQNLFKQPIAERVEFYNKFYLDFLYPTILCEYQNQYPLFNSAKLTIVKKIWQAAWYWAVIGLLTYHHKYADLTFMKTIEPDLARFASLQTQVQSFFINWHEKTSDEQPASPIYVDYGSMPFLKQLHNGMGAGLDDNRLKQQISENIDLLEEMATVIFQQAPELVEGMPSNTVNAEMMALFDKDIWQPLLLETASTYQAGVLN